jgi:sugar lactone lactonase YvrE
MAGASGLNLTVSGTGFVQASVVQWNQSNRPTTFVSSSQLQVALMAADLAVGGTAQIVVVNPGSGTSSPITFTINNPNPQISGVSPNTVTTIDGGMVVTITGTGFVSTSSVTWNGNSRVTSYVSGTQLQFQLLPVDVTAAGSAQISVSNPTPGGGTASPNPIMIVYAVPAISSLNPPAAVAGGPSFILTVNGSGFAPSSMVQYNGAPRATTYVSSTALTVVVTATDIATPATAQITVVTGTPGGGTAAPKTLTISNYAAPTITSINPTSITVNSPDTALSIQGSGFTTFSTVQVNGGNVTVNSWSANYLFATVPAATLTTVGSLSVTVSSPGPLVSGPVSISVTPNPTPTLSGVSPASAAVGSAGFTLSLSGSNFVPTSVVQWNGSPRVTTFVNGNQLTAAILPADVQSLGNNTVTVFNPSPGGGTSSASTFTTYLSLLTNDLIYDGTRKLLWASVPSSAGSPLGNTVVSIDPYTGLLGTPIWVGSEPNKLAISSDGTALWVGFLGTPSARKVDLTSGVLTPIELYFPGGWGGNIYATSLAVLPGSPSSIAVAAGLVSIYDDATARAKSSTGGASYLAFGGNSTTLYGYSNGLSVFSVDSSGIASTTTPANSGTYSYDLRYDNSRLYLTSGGVLDSTSGSLLGTFAAAGPVAPDSALGRAFILNSSLFGIPDQITAFDTNTFVPVGSFSIGGAPQSSFNNPSSLVRWAENGLAFRTNAQVYILQSPLVRDLSATPADIVTSVSAPTSAATGVSTSITVTVTNSGPNAASGVTLIDAFSSSAIFASVKSTQGNCGGGTPLITCNLGDLPTGATAKITLAIVPTLSGTFANIATVKATQPDPNLSNNTANLMIAITGAAYNAVPTLLSLAPQSAPTGASTLTLSVNGTNFSNASTLNWNGSNVPTAFVSSTQLTATIDASLLAAPGSADVTVNNAGPGGGVSSSLPFEIFQTVALDTNDIVFDPFTRKLYASVPSTASQVTGNSVVSIDPQTGTVGTPVFIGSEPTRLSISDDGQYLYAVLSGSNSVHRMSLPTLSAGTTFTTTSTLFGAFTPSDLAVMPGNPNALATVGYANGIQVWDVNGTGATARALTKSLANDVYEGSVLAWGDSANLYSNDEGLSPSSFHRFSVGATSFAETDSTYLDAVDGKISYSGGLIFSDGGGVVDPSTVPPITPKLVGRIMNPGGGPSAADATINRVFFLNQNSYGVNSRTISVFDTLHLTPAGATQLDGLAGDAFDLVRWGADGLAFRTATDFWGNGTGRVVMLHGSSVLPRSSTPNPVPSISGASPTSVIAPGPNTWVTVAGSGFVPGSVVLWNGSSRTTVFVSSSQLRVAIPGTDFVAPQIANLQVVNPTPGGGTSGQLSFKVN